MGVLYDTEILADSPVGYWKLNETSGTTAYDSSGNGNNGTLHGGITLNQPGPWSGGAAMTFNGSTGYITVPALANAISGSFTVEAWANYTNLTNTNGGEILSTRQPNDESFDIDFQADLHSDIGTGSAWLTTAANASYTFSLSTWYHVVMTVSTSSYSQYINGLLVNSSSLSGGTPLLTDSTHLINFGALNDSSQFLQGSLACIAIYSTALPPSRVLAHYRAAVHEGAAHPTMPMQVAATTTI